MASGDAGSESDAAPRAPAGLSTVELLKTITREVQQLAKTELALAKTELRADLSSELAVAEGLGVAAVAGLAALNLFLVAAALALARFLPAWLAALAVGALVAALACVAGLAGWGRRARRPLVRTRRALEEDVEWTKKKLT